MIWAGGEIAVAYELDIFGSGDARSASGALEGDLGHVDRRHPPAAGGQPDGVGPLTASHIQSGTWLEVA